MNFPLDVPPEIQIKCTLEQGYVYYFEESSFSSDTPHYFVVLNKTPLTDIFIVFVNATSQVEKSEKRQKQFGYPSETFVRVPSGQCSFLRKDSIFNCNSVIKQSVQSLMDKVNEGKLRLVGTMPDEIMKKLIDGVLISPAVEKRIKILI